MIDIEKMAFEELCYKYPKVAIEKISDDYKIYCEKVPHIGKCLNSKIDVRQPGKRESQNHKRHKPKKRWSAENDHVCLFSYKAKEGHHESQMQL